MSIEWKPKAPLSFAKVTSCEICNRGTPPGGEKIASAPYTGEAREIQAQPGGNGNGRKPDQSLS